MTRAPRIRAVLRSLTAAGMMLAIVALMTEGERLWRWAAGLPVGDELLYVSAATGDVKSVRRAMREGASPDALSPNNVPMLAVASAAGQRDVVALLIKAGADVDARFDGGMTALAYAACTTCDVETLRLLLEAGADPNAGRPCPPLVAAASNGKIEAVRLLLDHGADPDLRGKGPNDWSPLEAAVATKHDEIVALIRRARALSGGPGRSFPA